MSSWIYPCEGHDGCADADDEDKDDGHDDDDDGDDDDDVFFVVLTALVSKQSSHSAGHGIPIYTNAGSLAPHLACWKSNTAYLSCH